jgi:hypothetical protein
MDKFLKSTKPGDLPVAQLSGSSTRDRQVDRSHQSAVRLASRRPARVVTPRDCDDWDGCSVDSYRRGSQQAKEVGIHIQVARVLCVRDKCHQAPAPRPGRRAPPDYRCRSSRSPTTRVFFAAALTAAVLPSRLSGACGYVEHNHLQPAARIRLQRYVGGIRRTWRRVVRRGTLKRQSLGDISFLVKMSDDWLLKLRFCAIFCREYMQQLARTGIGPTL